MRERPVRLRHLLQVFPTLDRRAQTVARIQQLGGEATRHRLLAPLTRVADDPADRERGRAPGAHLDRHLVRGATDPSGLHLEHRPDVLHRTLERGDGVATGLALTILGIGLSGLIGAGFVGERITPAPHLYIPGLTDIPLVGRILFGEDPFIYVSLALVVGVWLFLYRTQAGLVLRAVGDNHVSAHALGYPVLRIRLLAVMFGGACAGLAGAYLPLAYTPFFIPGMTAGRGWIALALVVFASWLPGRLVIGAYLFGAVTILQLHAQGLGLGIPSQFMSALPYLATVIVLVLISRARTGGSTAPAALGTVFVPDR